MEKQTRQLPLMVALAAFVLYAATMGGGLTLSGLPLTSKLAGWDVIPVIGQPLLWLLTLPLQLLPLAWLPLAIKLLAAALAAAILGLLARTVQLLPWDHPWDNASRLVCALPILTAATLCGLEFSFWQQATATCGDLLDLLLLATAIWLLLEYNVRQKRSWLYVAAALYGAGMAENWLMLLAFPLFVAAIIAIERLHFFQWKLILRLAGLGLAGFAIYAVPPVVHGLTPHSQWTFSQSWLITFHQTRNLLGNLYHFARGRRLLVLGLAIYYLAPTLPLLVRMRDEGTLHKPAVDRLQIWLYRGLRLGLLLACCWLAFDPTPGIRQMLFRQAAGRTSMLSFDFVTALGAAFLLGNLLLIPHIAVRDPHYGPRRPKLWRGVAGAIAAAGVAAVAAGLLVRNAPPIVHANFHPLELYGDLAAKSLPPGRGVILSDRPERTAVLQMGLARTHRQTDWLAVDTQLLPSVPYRAGLEKRLPAGWLTAKNQHKLSPLETLLLLDQVARSNRVYYLHPSFSYFLEKYYLEPTGSVYEVKLRDKDPLKIPPLSAAAVAANEQFWTHTWDSQLAGLVCPRGASLAASKKHLGLMPAPRDQDQVLGAMMSVPLEAWAVTLQQQGHLKEARVRLEQVLKLNTNNLSARCTFVCNANLQTTNKLELAGLPRLGSQNLVSDGPFDEPVSDYVLGLEYFGHGLRVQAAEQFQRAWMLASNSFPVELALANAYNQLQMPDRSRPLINELRERLQKAPTNSVLDLDVALLDSYSWLLQTNVSHARDVLHSVVTQHPDDLRVADSVINAYLAFNDVTNALQLVDAQLARTPDDVGALNTKASILIQGGRPAEAISFLDRAIALTNQPGAHINRAFARIAMKDFAGASNELNVLKANTNTAAVADFGLALVSVNAADTNSAKLYLQHCISNTPAGASIWYQANALLHHLEAPGTNGMIPK